MERNAEQWDEYEVAHWVQSIGFEYAMKRFFAQKVDGNVLLHDVTASMLVNQLGVTSMHCRKMMRSLKSLRDKVLGSPPGPLLCDFTVTAVSIDSESATKNSKFEEEMASLKSEHQRKVQELEEEVRSATNEGQQSVLAVGRDLNKSEEKLLKSQQENMALNAQIAALKETAKSLDNAHNLEMDALRSEHQKEMAQFEGQRKEYEEMKSSFDSVQQRLAEKERALSTLKAEFEDNKQTADLQLKSMKSSYESVSQQLTESQQALSALQIRAENDTQSNALRVESMERQFKRETANLENAMTKLQSAADERSDEAKVLRETVHSLKRDLEESGRRLKASEETVDSMTGNLAESKQKVEALKEAQSGLKMELSESRMMAEHSKQSMDAIKEQLAETRRKLEEAQRQNVTPLPSPRVDQSKSDGDSEKKSSMILDLEEFVEEIEAKANDDGLSFAEHVECRHGLMFGDFESFQVF